MSAATDTPTTKGKKPRLSDRARSEQRLGWKLAMPAFVVMLLVTAYPILQAVWNSFFYYRLTDPDNREFVGLNNYLVSFSDSVFWKAMWMTILVTIITVVVELVLGFIIALVMHRIVIPRRTLRTIVLIPYSIITVVSGFTWLYAFRTDTGFVNQWTSWIPGVSENFDWFGSFWPAVFVISLSEIWKTTPFMSLLLLAGLAQVDSSMEEAAKVDGASWMQVLVKVILPSMKAAVMVALLFRTLDAFRIFDNIFIMTGGANDTSSLSMLIYRQTIDRTEIGLGSALSVILFLCVLIIAGVFVKAFKVDLAEGRS
ncbi:MAG: carbohydrate ABC transporter permease [Janibacter sp.]